jgi:hypothetical protein
MVREGKAAGSIYLAVRPHHTVKPALHVTAGPLLR